MPFSDLYISEGARIRIVTHDRQGREPKTTKFRYGIELAE